jgi:hypothetical protein
MKKNFTLVLLAAIFLSISELSFGQSKVPQQRVISEQLSGKHVVEKAMKQITASNVISEGTVEYIAGDAIILKPGFYVPKGANFFGIIQKVEEEQLVTERLPAEHGTGFDETKFLSNVYPNPFIKDTDIEYWLPKSTVVRLTVINNSGREVARLVNDQSQLNGRHKVKFSPGILPAGIYQIVISTPDARLVHKLVKE